MSKLDGGKIRAGALWTYAGQVYITAGGFIVGIIIARLLGPAEIGVFIAVTAFTSLLLLTSQLGMPQALLQAKTLTGEQSNSAFWIVAAAAIVFASIVVLTAEHLAVAFDSQRFAPVMLAMTIPLVLSPYNCVSLALLRREMKFDQVALISGGSWTIASALSLILAFAGAGAFSLVAGAIVGMAFNTVMFWRLTGWRPGRPSVGPIKPLIRYAMFTNLNVMLGSATGRVDNMLVGSLLGTAALGLYNRAYSLSRLPADEFAHSLGPLVLGSLSRIQDDKDWSRALYFKAISAISALSLPFMVALFVVGPLAIDLVYGAEWSGAGLPLQIMLFGTVFLAVSLPSKSLINAQGLVKEYAVINALMLAGTIGLVIVLSQFGLVAVAAGIALREVVMFFLVAKLLRRSWLEITLRDLWQVVMPIVLAGLLSLFGGWLLMHWAVQIASFGRVLTLLLTGGGVILVYGIALAALMWVWRSHVSLQHTRGLVTDLAAGAVRKYRRRRSVPAA